MTAAGAASMPGRVTFGVSLYTGQRAPGRVGPLYRDAAALARSSEDAGFDTFWVSEHHGFADGYLPAPLVLLAAVAEATSRIRLGTGVALGPLCQPVRLAEEAAVVDHLSGGRLILGLGVGYHGPEFAMFGVDPATRGRRLDEVVGILRRCWSGETFSWHGEQFDLEDVRVTPVPVQEGGIPVWLGGYAPAALRRAALVADGHLVGRGDPDIVRTSAAIVRDALGERARPFTFGLNLTVVLTDPGGHPASARAGFAYQQRTYERVQAGTDVYAGRVDARGGGTALALGSIDRYVHVAGPAAHVVDALAGVLADLAGWAHVHVALRLLFPEDDPGRQHERIARVGADVLTPLRRRLATGGRPA